MTFYSCGPKAPEMGAGSGTARKSHQRVIDVHCHLLVPEAGQLMQPYFRPELEPATRFTTARSAEINAAMMKEIHGRITKAEDKIADMDRMGIDFQVLSPAPPQYYYWAEPELGWEAARLINEKIAAVVTDYPERFAGLCTVPMQAPELAVLELRRAVGELGLRGVEISSNVAGEELAAERFRPFFAAAEELGVLVFLHPLGFTQGERLREFYLNNAIGNPVESAIAVSHLIFGGVLDRFPGLKICVAHGGGYLPTYSGRLDHVHRVRPECQHCARKPSEYLRDLYYDTVVFDEAQIGYLVRQYGADHVLLGTDHPFDMGEPDPVGLLDRVASLTPDERAKILGGNAERLLRLRA